MGWGWGLKCPLGEQIKTDHPGQHPLLKVAISSCLLPTPSQVAEGAAAQPLSAFRPLESAWVPMPRTLSSVPITGDNPPPRALGPAPAGLLTIQLVVDHLLQVVQAL